MRSTVSLRATGPGMRFVRFESNEASSEAKDPRKQLLEARDDLQRDWDAKEITYEILKQRTLQPTPVSAQSGRYMHVISRVLRTRT